MRSVNKVILLGHLGKDSETNFTTSGVPCTKFSLATSRRYKSGDEWKEETDWHNVVLWRAENLAQFLTKGKPVYLEGRIQTRSYEKDGEKRYITEIVADNVILVGGKSDSDQSDRPVSAPRSSGSLGTVRDTGRASEAMFSDEDVPF